MPFFSKKEKIVVLTVRQKQKWFGMAVTGLCFLYFKLRTAFFTAFTERKMGDDRFVFYCVQGKTGLNRKVNDWPAGNSTMRFLLFTWGNPKKFAAPAAIAIKKNM